MDDIRAESVEEARHPPELGDGQPDCRIWRKGRRRHPKLVGGGNRLSLVVGRIPWRDDDDIMAKGLEHVGDPRDHGRDAVHLWRVSV
jgi:hypothetical protein